MKDALPVAQELSLSDDVVRLFTAGELLWEVPVADVRVIGEYTTESGPLADDWFVLFVGSEGNWFETPTDATNVESVLSALSKRLGSPITLGLANSTSFRSRILWPPSLRGQDLLSFRPQRLQNWLFRRLFRRVEYSLTQAVLNAIN